MTPRLSRTYLAVPAHRERLVASAARSDADAVFLDLEDAVPADAKAQALDAALAALDALDWGGKTVAVRINATARAQWISNEVEALARAARLDALIVPKTQDVGAISALAARLGALGRPTGRPPLELELLIETARGLVNVESLAGAAPCVTALHFGVGDFAASIGARSAAIGGSPDDYRQLAKDAQGAYHTTPLDLMAYPMMRILVAARAFGLRAIDGPCGDFRDLALSAAWARKAAAMGFDGKQVIHPGQIGVTRDAFVPSADEIARARRIVDALGGAHAHGLGAISVDGQLVDYANLRTAERMLALAGG